MGKGLSRMVNSPGPPPDTAQGLGKHFRTVSLATTISRISGFARDMVNAAIFGAGTVSDAYFSALRIPSLLRDLFAEGALSSAFVPTLSKSLRQEDARRTWELISQVFTFLLLSTGVVVGLGIVAAPWIVRLIAPGFLADPAKFALTIELTRLLFPVLLFVSMAAFWMGCLNAHHQFSVAAFAPVAMNLTLIGAGAFILLFEPLGPGADMKNIIFWTWATTLGMAFQWLIQVPAAWKLGGRLRLSWPPRHPGFFEILGLMAPAIFSLSVTQVDLMLNQIFASFLPTGSVSCLNYGNRLMQLPYGVFGVSIATVVYPLISRQAADRDRAAYQQTLSRALEASIFISFPCTLGLWLVSLPICRLAFEHGQFSSDSTRLVAQATCMYILGMSAQTGIKILTQAFYPIGKPKWAFWAALANMTTTASLNLAALLFIPDAHLKFLAFPLATSAGAFMNFLILYAGLEKYGVRFDLPSIRKESAKVIAATLVMGLATWMALRLLEGRAFPGMGVAMVFIPIGVGAAAYFIAAKVLGCESLSWIISRKKDPPAGPRAIR